MLIATLDGLASTLGDFSRRADRCDSMGRRSGGAIAMTPLVGTSDGETREVAPVTEFLVSGCCSNHDASCSVIMPEFRNREPAFGTSQKASPQLVVRKRVNTISKTQIPLS